MDNPSISLIIPVFNRPNEVEELLESLTRQTARGFEVVIVEDGSTIASDEVADRYRDRLAVRDGIARTGADAFGGPDKASDDFTDVQKAINYAMTSFFTTGGIRGGKKKMDKFYPRSFNMGIRAEVFRALGGFSRMRFGEDIDFSIRLFKGGYKVCLFPAAWVYHKRRTDWRKFYRQVYNFGIARINLYKKYPDSLKVVHLLPALFTLGCLVLLVGALVCPWAPLPLGIYALLIGIDASLTNRSPRIGALAIIASFIQLIGYGSGFLAAFWQRVVRGKDEYSAFQKTFYK